MICLVLQCMSPILLNFGRYIYSSPESQIRVLADYAFMLHDYELALSTYRLLSSDYKTDKAWKRYAGVQVCLYSNDSISKGGQSLPVKVLYSWKCC